MIFKKTKINGPMLILPKKISDNRGVFERTFCKNELKKENIAFDIAQVNLTLTKSKGCIRGMHFQETPFEEDKIVQCIKGSIFDVALDLRKDSLTFGKWIAEELSGENQKMLFIPKGFAHGFQSLTNNCKVQYFMSEYYSPKHSKGVRFNDPFFKISWPLKTTSVSEKDKDWPLFK